MVSLEYLYELGYKSGEADREFGSKTLDEHFSKDKLIQRGYSDGFLGKERNFEGKQK